VTECPHLKGWVDGEAGFMDWPECGLADGAERLCVKDGDRVRKNERDWTTCYRFWRALAEELGRRLRWHVTDSGHVYPERELSEAALSKLKAAKEADRG